MLCASVSFPPEYHFYHFQFILIIFPKVLLHIIYCVLTVLSPFCCFSDGFHFCDSFLLLLWALQDYVSSRSVVSLQFFFLSSCNLSLNSLINSLGYFEFMAICLAKIFICLVAIFFLLAVFLACHLFFLFFFPKSIFKWFCLYPLKSYYHTILIEVGNHVCVSYLHKAYVGRCLGNIGIGSD